MMLYISIALVSMGMYTTASVLDCATLNISTSWNKTEIFTKPVQVGGKCYFASFKPMTRTIAEELCKISETATLFWEDHDFERVFLLFLNKVYPNETPNNSYHRPIEAMDFVDDIPVVKVEHGQVVMENASLHSKHVFICKYTGFHKGPGGKGQPAKTQDPDKNSRSLVVIAVFTMASIILITIVFVSGQVVKLTAKDSTPSPPSSPISIKEVPAPSSYLSPEQKIKILMEPDPTYNNNNIKAYETTIGGGRPIVQVGAVE